MPAPVYIIQNGQKEQLVHHSLLTVGSDNKRSIINVRFLSLVPW